MDDDKLWIVNDQDALDEDRPSESESGAWVLMTVSGMGFRGEWAPGEYKRQNVVTHNDKLYVANEDILDVPFEFVGGNWDDSTGGTPSAPIAAVHTDAVVGDVMIWIGAKFGFGAYCHPTDVGWTTIMEQPLQSGSFPSGTLGVYGNVIEVGHLGTTKTTRNTTDYQLAQLVVYRGTLLPVPAEVDYTLF